MDLVGRVHEDHVHTRRVRVLSERIAAVLPRDATVVDVGCGDGLLARKVLDARPDLSVSGIDVLIRGRTHVPVRPFDGARIPFEDRSVDVVLFVDVLHHTDDPMILLAEASRVARRAIVIKDHLLEGWLAGPTLRFMDRTGNAKHGVALPHNYWTRARWQAAFTSLGIGVESWDERLGLYPKPFDWVFGRTLHFLASLRPNIRNVSA
jgi:SAM-dependent methyltransferase